MSKTQRAIERRQLLKATALAGSAGLLKPLQAAGTSQRFVLVHGTWHGGWVWRDLARRLVGAGHTVLTPTCTGCGEREHLSQADVGLDTHIRDVTEAIRFAELEDFVLVGHSFAGLTITGVADRLRSRVRRIVFLDALVPRPGRMAAIPRDPESGAYPAWWQERTRKFVDGYKMVLWEDYPVDMLVPPDMTEHVARLKQFITTHPARQWTDELILANGGWEGLRPAYIHCVGQRYRQSSDMMLGPAREPGWRFIELDAPRNAMMTHPRQLAELLIVLAET
ncbi:MAG: alpha/beta fold hydrolase [Pseudomonadota bacterium]